MVFEFGIVISNIKLYYLVNLILYPVFKIILIKF